MRCASFRPCGLTPIEADVCVVGGGPGGLSAAAELALRGRRVVVVNDGPLMGYGIEGAFKSKSEFEIERQYLQSHFRPKVFGETNPPSWDRVRSVIELASAGLEKMLTGRLDRLGVHVVEGRGRFINDHTVETESEQIRAPHIIIATRTKPRSLGAISLRAMR